APAAATMNCFDDLWRIVARNKYHEFIELIELGRFEHLDFDQPQFRRQRTICTPQHAIKIGMGGDQAEAGANQIDLEVPCWIVSPHRFLRWKNERMVCDDGA